MFNHIHYLLVDCKSGETKSRRGHRSKAAYLKYTAAMKLFQLIDLQGILLP